MGVKLPHVVMIGGGFGGLTAARALKSAQARVTLIDRTNHHLFQPLLYQVAMAGLSPGDADRQSDRWSFANKSPAVGQLVRGFIRGAETPTG